MFLWLINYACKILLIPDFFSKHVFQNCPIGEVYYGRTGECLPPTENPDCDEFVEPSDTTPPGKHGKRMPPFWLQLIFFFRRARGPVPGLHPLPCQRHRGLRAGGVQQHLLWLPNWWQCSGSCKILVQLNQDCSRSTISESCLLKHVQKINIVFKFKILIIHCWNPRSNPCLLCKYCVKRKKSQPAKNEYLFFQKKFLQFLFFSFLKIF